MMYSEFMEIAGYKVTYEDYNNIIEPMYMAAPDNMTKADFIACLNRKRFEVKPRTESQIIHEARKVAQFLYDNCGRRSYHEEKDKVEAYARELEKMLNIIVITIPGYEYEEVQRGCTYPREFVYYTADGRGNEVKRVKLIREE